MSAVTRPPKLLDRVAASCRVRHLSPRTEDAYRHWVRQYVLYHGVRHPDTMAEPEVNAFLTHLAVEGRVSASTQNQALAALLFLYQHVLNRPLKTTMIYTHVLNRGPKAVRSPLDGLGG